MIVWLAGSFVSWYLVSGLFGQLADVLVGGHVVYWLIGGRLVRWLYDWLFFEWCLTWDTGLYYNDTVLTVLIRPHINILSCIAFLEIYSDSDQESSPSSDEHHDDHISRRQDMRQPVDDITRRGSSIRVQESLSSSRTPSPSRSDQLKDSRRSSDEVVSVDGSQHSRRSRILLHSPILGEYQDASKMWS